MTGNNFAEFKNVTIRGTKYEDVYGDDTPATVGTADDGPLDINNPHYVSVTVHLLDNGVDQGIDNDNGTNGGYTFTNNGLGFGPGIYTVSKDVPTGSTRPPKRPRSPRKAA